MHVGSAAGVRRARRRRTRSSSSAIEAPAAPGAALPPAARLRAASGRAGRCGSTTRTSTPRYHVRHTALPAPGQARPSSSASPAALFSQQLDRDKPLWEMWLVEGLDGDRFALVGQDPPRAGRRRLGRGHHDRPVRHRARPGAGRRRPSAVGPAARCPATPSCWPTRCSSAPTVPGEIAARRARAGPRARAQVAGRVRREAWRGVGAHGLGRAERRAAEPAQRADRPAPALHLGRRRPAPSSRRSRTRSAARSTTSCSPRSRCALGALPARAAARTPTSSSCKAMVPVSRARRGRARRARQPRRRDVRAAAGRRRGPGRALRRSSTRRWRTSRSPARRSAPQVLTELAGFAPPTIMSQAARLQCAPALLQPRRDQRPRARSSRCTCSAAGCRRSTRRCRSRQRRRWASRS